MSTAELLEKAKKIFYAKSPQSRALDLAQLSKHVCKPDDERCIKEWIRRKGVGIDIIGLDTPPTKERIEKAYGETLAALPPELRAKVEEVLRKRSPRSLAIDVAMLSKHVCRPGDTKCVEEWIRRRGVGIDILGIDTPEVFKTAKSISLASTVEPTVEKHVIVEWFKGRTELAQPEKPAPARKETVIVKEKEKTIEQPKPQIKPTPPPLPQDAKKAIKTIEKELHDYKRAVDAEQARGNTRLEISFRGIKSKDLFWKLVDSIKSMGGRFNSTTKTWILAPSIIKLDIEDIKPEFERLFELLNEAREEGAQVSVKFNGKVIEEFNEKTADEIAEEFRKTLTIPDVIAASSMVDYAYYMIPWKVINRAPSLMNEIHSQLSYTIRKYDPYARKYRDIEYFVYRKSTNGLLIPRGVMDRVKKILDERLGDDATAVIPYAPWILEAYNVESPIKLRPYQWEAVASVLGRLAMYGGTILQAATGAGKTEMALDVIARILKLTKGKLGATYDLTRKVLEKMGINIDKYSWLKGLMYMPHDIGGANKIVIMSLSTDLLHQFKERAKKYGIDIGIVSADKFEIDKPVIAVTVQSVYNALKKLGLVKEKKLDKEALKELGLGDEIKIEEYNIRDPRKLAEIVRNAALIVFDEVQHVPAETVKAVVSVASKALKLGLSATPWRDDMKDLEIYAAIGDIAPRKITSSELIEKGYLVPAVIIMASLDLPDYENIRRSIINCKGPQCYQKVKSAVYSNTERNKLIAKLAAELKKRGFVPGLVLVKEKKHGAELEKLFKEEGLKTIFVSSEMKPSEREKVFNMVRRGELDFIIATTLADEGLDLPPLRTLILAAPTKSRTRTLQRIGRVIRPYPGKTYGLVIDIVDELPYFEEHGHKRLELYHTEPEWAVLRIKARNADDIIRIVDEVKKRLG